MLWWDWLLLLQLFIRLTYAFLFCRDNNFFLFLFFRLLLTLRLLILLYLILLFSFTILRTIFFLLLLTAFLIIVSFITWWKLYIIEFIFFFVILFNLSFFVGVLYPSSDIPFLIATILHQRFELLALLLLHFVCILLGLFNDFVWYNFEIVLQLICKFLEIVVFSFSFLFNITVSCSKL